MLTRVSTTACFLNWAQNYTFLLNPPNFCQIILINLISYTLPCINSPLQLLLPMPVTPLLLGRFREPGKFKVVIVLYPLDVIGYQALGVA